MEEGKVPTKEEYEALRQQKVGQDVAVELLLA